MYDLLASLLRHRGIPSTFDGSNPFLLFRPGPPRLVVGQKYITPDKDGNDRVSTLTQALVLGETDKVMSVYVSESGETFTGADTLGESELMAYREHPETFFGTIDPNAHGNCENPMDFFERSRPIYEKTPREKLIEWMSGGGVLGLENLSHAELADLFCERFADSAFSRRI